MGSASALTLSSPPHSPPVSTAQNSSPLSHAGHLRCEVRKQMNTSTLIYSKIPVRLFIESELYTSTNPISFFWQIFLGFLCQPFCSLNVIHTFHRQQETKLKKSKQAILNFLSYTQRHCQGLLKLFLEIYKTHLNSSTLH